MTQSRKLIGIVLLACFALSALIAVGVYGIGTYKAVAVETTNVGNYFGQQLKTNEQKEIYKAMQQMNAKEIFIKGEDYDLVAGGHVTQSQLEAYANGDRTLLDAMGAARDAFYTDYDDIFYVDFGYLSLRVTQDANGYHAWLGSGRAETYWTKGFTSEAQIRSAIDKYNTALKTAVDAAKSAQPTEKQIKALGDRDLATQFAQIREAHRQVAINTVYRLEDDAKNEGFVRTVYGVFNSDAMGEALCEGYSRAFKAILDELQIPCVLVNGVYRHGNNKEELHMWTHVQMLDGSWYAVDPTFDDLNYDDEVKYPPDKYDRLVSRKTPLDEIPNTLTGDKEEKEENAIYAKELGYNYSEDYFLKGAAYMNTQHATSPYKSEVEYPFTYPELSEQNIGGEVSLTHGVFKVVQTPFDNELNSTNIYVSVLIDGEWCGYAEAEAKGYYILVRYEGDYLPEKLKNNQDLSHVGDDEYLFQYGSTPSNSISTLVWAYLNPVRNPYPLYPSIEEHEGYTLIQNESKSTGFEFALTTRAPREYVWGDRSGYTVDEIAEMTTFTGDMTMFEARSGFIETQFGDPHYQPAPHIVKSTPALTGKLLLSSYQKRSYDITVEYDQVLTYMDGATELEMSVFAIRATGEILKGTHAIKLYEVVDKDSIEYDLGDDLPDGTYRCGSISFRFTPYEAWAYDNVEYIFNFNLEGKRSHRQVNPATYAVGYECEALCYKAYGYHWNVFAQPQLLEDEDLSRTGWKDSDGNNVSDTKSRLALVVTKPSGKQDKEMMDMIGEEFNEDILKSFTYNISLTICKSIIIETGQGVRVCVGFPEGFTYSDSMNGVAFKAYHFVRDKWDNIVDVEEIECTVTPLGLVLLCKSFSPFAIVAATADPSDVTTDKSVVLTNTNGGSVNATEKDGTHTKMFNVKEGESRNVTIKANNGYVIESIKINGNVEPSNFESAKTLTLNYNGLTAQNIVEVTFVAQSIKENDESRGQSSVVQQLKKAEITLANSAISVNASEQIKITATVNSYGDADSYQWYKDGKVVAGQNSKTLLIEHAETTDAGKYTLSVTSSYGASVAVAISSEIEVSVTQSPASDSGNGGGLGTAELITLIISLIGVCAIGIFIAVILNLRKTKKNGKK